MNNKINISELAEIFAESNGFDKKTAENFIKEFQKIIIEGLERDKIVKIAGLGTFKLTLIAERKSVNVQTGESITIPAHYKVSFSADNAMKESLNNPNRDAQIDPLKKMAEQANEINDILKEFSEMKTSNEQTVEEEKVVEIVETPIQEPEPQKVEEEVKVVPNPKPTPKPTPTPPPAKPKYRWLIWTTFGCIVLMALGFVYYLYSDEINSLFEDNSTEVVIEETIKPAEEPTPKPEPKLSVFEQPIDYSQTLANETIRKGTRLSYFAKQYYGHPDFWIYIYEANKNAIENPSSVLVGTTIRIPKLPAELVDANSEKAVTFAVELAKKRK